MLVEIQNKIVSTQIFERQFVCDLTACKGACCIEGNGGAPVTKEEVDIIEANLDKVLPYMRPEGIAAIEAQGVVYEDEDFEPATTLVNGKECAFVYFDQTNTAKCAIEKAHREGQIDFIKPISCHLYPIRTKQFNEYTALNYEKWDICEPACACGEKLDVPVYKFLKEPLIRAFGPEFYKELEIVSRELDTEH
jgi:hypothetical protein